MAAACNIFLTQNNLSRQREGSTFPPAGRDCQGLKGSWHRRFSFRTVTAAPHGHFGKRYRSYSVQDRRDGDFSWAITNRDLIGSFPLPNVPCTARMGNRIAFALRDHLQRASISAAGPSLSGILRHLIIRTTQDDREAVAMLVVTRNDKSLRKPVRALLASENRPDGFFININDEPGPFMIGPQTIRIEGKSHVREEIGGLSYLISPAAFFQTNVQAATVLQRSVNGGVPVSDRARPLLRQRFVFVTGCRRRDVGDWS